MAIKLVLSDIDGTLLPRGNAEVDHCVVEAFHALLDAGLAVGPASGRALPAILPAFAGDQACVATVLATNGMQVYAAGKLVHEEYLDHEGLVQLAAAVREVPRAGMICFKGAEVFLVEGERDVLAPIFPSYAAHITSVD
uniref:HAD family hydrolase n=1 Tax=Collinsella bouchesdurhonensis TaxID=1907654 RepID=UPI0034A5BAFD